MTDHKKTVRPPSDATLFDALSVERWSQRTALGRPVVSEVVDKIEGTIGPTLFSFATYYPVFSSPRPQ